MSDPLDTRPRASRPSEPDATRDAKALLDAADAGAPHGASDRLGTIQSLLRKLWHEVQAQQAEAEALRGRLAEATDAAEHAVADLKAAETAAADREADLRKELMDKSENLAFSNAQQAQLAGEIERLRGKLDAARRAPAPEARAAQAVHRPPPQPSVPRPAPRPPVEAPPAAATPLTQPPEPQADPPSVESVYGAFCREAGGLNSRAELFASTLRQAFPTADVRTVYRDADSPARPVVLTADRRGNSAVPFWAVSIEGRHLLVPQPMGADQFRELAPCFTGQASPAALTEIVPAPLTTLGADFALTTAGRVA